MMLTTMDGEDFPHPINADIVKKYYALEIRTVDTPRQDRVIPANQRCGQKLGIYAKDCTPGKSKIRKGGLGKNGYPGGLKTQKGSVNGKGHSKTLGK